MAAASKNIMIGIFVAAALAIIIFILLFLHPTVGDNAKTLRVRFTDIDKITIGTRVSYAGRPVGEVVDIKEIEDARTGRIAQNGDIYVYELILKVDSAVDVYNTDLISIRTSGLLGERSISIMPEPILPGESLFLVNDEILYSIPAGSVEETFKQINNLSKKFHIVLENIADLFDEIKQEQIIPKFSMTVQNIHEISDALNQPEKVKQTLDNIWSLSQRANTSWVTVDKTLSNFYEFSDSAKNSWTGIDRSIDNFHALTERAQQSWTSVDQSLAQLNEATINMNHFSDQANQLMAHVSNGKGSLGRLLVDDELYLRLKSVFSKGETILNDVNQYGALFHLNKSWQRANARRTRLLEKLSTPDEFAVYFNDEINRISTSLSRVSMVLNETESYPQSLIQNATYRNRFSELLRRVTDIEDALKMYNQQVIDQEEIGQNCD